MSCATALLTFFAAGVVVFVLPDLKRRFQMWWRLRWSVRELRAISKLTNKAEATARLLRYIDHIKKWTREIEKENEADL